MVDVSLQSRVTLSPEVMLQEVSGEAVLLDLKSESYFGLDAVGTRIWRLVEENRSLTDVHAALLAEYDVDAARLARDLTQLIGRLVEAGLASVERADAHTD